jgi:hypothetical protein
MASAVTILKSISPSPFSYKQKTAHQSLKASFQNRNISLLESPEGKILEVNLTPART